MVPERQRVLGCPVDVVDLETVVDRLVALVEARREGRLARPGVVVTLNPEMVMQAQRDETFRAILESAALVVPDGIGVVHALRRRGCRDAVRVPGVDLLDAYFARAAALGHRVALVGAAPGVAAAAAERYRERYAGIEIVFAGSDNPTLRTVERLWDAQPEVVAAAYGHGRQERFLAEHLGTIGAACGIGIGGSLDYAAGQVRRAPALVRRTNLEWAWRLALQPWRIRRQAKLPVFWWKEHREAR